MTTKEELQKQNKYAQERRAYTKQFYVTRKENQYDETKYVAQFNGS